MKEDPRSAVLRITIQSGGGLVRIRSEESPLEYHSANLLLTRAEARELVAKLEDALVTEEDSEMEVTP